MNLLVLGASGQVGRHVLEQAVARGHGTTAFVRPSTAFDGPVPVVRDEVLRNGALLAALPGHDAVICCIGPKRRSLNPWSELLSPPDLCGRTAELLVEAMRAAEVAKVVAISTAGVGDSGPHMNLVMRTVVATSNVGVAYADLDRMEQVLEASRLDWCCLRPVTLVDGERTGRVREVDHFGLTMTIRRADVAHALLERVEGPIRNRRPQIAG